MTAFKRSQATHVRKSYKTTNCGPSRVVHRECSSRRKEVVVALDWTDFDTDHQSTLALNIITSHGRATPLMQETHDKATLNRHRSDCEDDLLAHFCESIPHCRSRLAYL